MLRSRRDLAFAVSLIPAAALIPWIIRTWVNIPYHDDWGTPGHQLVLLCQGALTPARMFAQHNESRPFFARLVFIPLAWFGGWDVRRVICATFGLVCVAAYLLFVLIRRLPGITWAGTLMPGLAVNLILFWPNSEIWAYSNNLMLVFPPVALLSALLINLSGISLREKILWNSLLATVSTYWWANGMLLWLLAIPLSNGTLRMRMPGGEERKQVPWYLFYVAAGIVNIWFYFHDYRRPPDSPPLSGDAGKIFSYFFTWIGAFFGDENMARVIGACVFVVFMLLACVSVLRGFKRRDFTDCYPWLALGLYAVASGLMAAAGRSGFGESQAMSPRYTAVSGYLYIAIAGLGCLTWNSLGEKLSPGKLRLARWTALVAGLLCIPFTVQSYARGVGVLATIGEHRKALLTAWQWSKAIPESPELELLLPNVEMLNEFGAVLEEHHILRLTRFDPAIISHWSYAGKAADATNGVFNSCEITPDGWLSVSGWSSLPDRSGAADFVLLTSCEAGANPRPLAMLPTHLASPDVAAALNNDRMSRSGFRMAFPMDRAAKGKLEIAAWAVDLKQSVIRPLAHTYIATEP